MIAAAAPVPTAVAPGFRAYCRDAGITRTIGRITCAVEKFTDPLDTIDYTYVVPLDPGGIDSDEHLHALLDHFAGTDLLLRLPSGAAAPARLGLVRYLAYLVHTVPPAGPAGFPVREATTADDIAFVTDLLERSYAQAYSTPAAGISSTVREHVRSLGLGRGATRALIVTDDRGRRLGHLTATEEVVDEVTELACDEVVDVMFAERPPAGAEASLVAEAARRAGVARRALLGRVTHNHPDGPRIERRLVATGWHGFYDVWSNRPDVGRPSDMAAPSGATTADDPVRT